MDLDALLAPRPDSPPSGENLEYDGDFTEMEIASLPGDDRQMNDTIIPGEDPDFKDARAKVLIILERSHDLRAGVILAYCNVNLSGLAGLADATSYIRRCLEQYWDSCHPQLDADDDNDPTMRVNAVGGLADARTVMRGLRDVQLTKSRNFGRYSLRDIQTLMADTAAGGGGEDSGERDNLNKAFRETAETDPGFLQNLIEAARRVQADIKAIDAKFMQETPGQGPNLDDITKAVMQIIRYVGEHVALPAGAEVPKEEDDAPAMKSAPARAAPARASGGGGGGGTMDVVAALDAIIAHYKHNEPSSPLPILLLRARRLVDADFMTIMKDIAPNGVDNVMMIGGIADD